MTDNPFNEGHLGSSSLEAAEPEGQTLLNGDGVHAAALEIVEPDEARFTVLEKSPSKKKKWCWILAGFILMVGLILGAISLSTRPQNSENICTDPATTLPTGVVKVKLYALHLRFEVEHFKKDPPPPPLVTTTEAVVELTRRTECIVVDFGETAAEWLESIHLVYPTDVLQTCYCSTTQTAECTNSCADVLHQVDANSRFGTIKFDGTLDVGDVISIFFSFGIPLNTLSLRQGEGFFVGDSGDEEVYVTGQFAKYEDRLIPGFDGVWGRGVEYKVRVTAPTFATVLSNQAVLSEIEDQSKIELQEAISTDLGVTYECVSECSNWNGFSGQQISGVASIYATDSTTSSFLEVTLPDDPEWDKPMTAIVHTSTCNDKEGKWRWQSSSTGSRDNSNELIMLVPAMGSVTGVRSAQVDNGNFAIPPPSGGARSLVLERSSAERIGCCDLMPCGSNTDSSRITTFEGTTGENIHMMGVAIGRLNKFPGAPSTSGVAVTIYAVPGVTRADVEVPLMVIAKSIDFWQDWTGQMLETMTKLDLLIDSSSSSWASSHSGILFMDRFRTLWNPSTGTTADLVRCVNVICHEVGHAWFGGLVSAVDGVDKFITESMTSYVENKCTQTVFPGLVNGDLYTLQYDVAFQDSMQVHKGPVFNSLQSMLNPANDGPLLSDSPPSGHVEYWKGATFMHMLEQYFQLAVSSEVNELHSVIRAFLADSAGTAAPASRLLHFIAARLSGVEYSSITTLLNKDPDHVFSGKVRVWYDKLSPWLTQPSAPVLQFQATSVSVGIYLKVLQTPLCQLRSALVSGSSSIALCAQDEELEWWLPISVGTPRSEVTSFKSRFYELGPNEVDDQTSGKSLDQELLPWIPRLPMGSYGLFYIFPDSPTSMDNTDAAVASLNTLQLSDATLASVAAGTFPSDTEDAATVLSIASYIDDFRLQFTLEPSQRSLDVLFNAIQSLSKSQMILQSGATAYSLLSPIMNAINDLSLLASGYDECWATVTNLIIDAIVPIARTLWSRALTDGELSDLTTVSQDVLMTRMIAAAVVPKASSLDSELAAQICALLPTGNITSYSLLINQLGLSPDLQNIIIQVAVSKAPGCKVPENFVQVLTDAFASLGDTLNSHAARSVVFALASSSNVPFLRDELLYPVLANPSSPVYAQLRDKDKVALVKQIALQTLRGKQIAREVVVSMRPAVVANLNGNWEGLTVYQEGLLITADVSDDLSELLEGIPDRDALLQRHNLQLQPFTALCV